MFVADGCALLMQQRVELGNVLVLDFALPDGFRLAHAYYRKPDGRGRCHFGDLVGLAAPRSTEARGSGVPIVHSAVYQADDLVFTKNGRAASEPWFPMKLDALLDRYRSLGDFQDPLWIAYYRKHPWWGAIKPLECAPRPDALRG